MIHGIAERTILWNALQMHPHRPDDHRSNRTPTPAEIEMGVPAIQMLVARYPRARVIAVGKKAEGLLAGVTPVAVAIRHPANGGATEFAEGLLAAIQRRRLGA